MAIVTKSDKGFGGGLVQEKEGMNPHPFFFLPEILLRCSLNKCPIWAIVALSMINSQKVGCGSGAWAVGSPCATYFCSVTLQKNYNSQSHILSRRNIINRLLTFFECIVYYYNTIFLEKIYDHKTKI